MTQKYHLPNTDFKQEPAQFTNSPSSPSLHIPEPPAGKGGFFSESAMYFSNLQISKKKNIPKNYPELEI